MIIIKNKRIIKIIIFIVITIIFAIVAGKTYAKYILTKNYDATISSSAFYFEAKVSNPTVTVQERPNKKLYVNPTFDLVIQNNDETNFNSYEVTYTVSIVDNPKISFENGIITKTIVGGNKKNEELKLNFNIKDLEDIPETATIRITTTKPYSKTIDLSFNLKKVWVIQRIEDLVDFSKTVNDGKSYENENVILLNNLDFNNTSDYENASRLDYEDYNGDGTRDTLINELKKDSGFIPIGYGKGSGDYHFEGNFDGQDYTIKNLYVKNEELEYNAGLFGAINGASIKNLTLEGTVTASQYGGIGGIVGGAQNSKIDNCTNKANVSVTVGRYQAGGIVSSASASTITNCKNYGEISEGNHTAGIVGIIGNSDNGEVQIKGCHNYGKISNTSGTTAIGGIVGHQTNATADLAIIDDCHNHGLVTVNNNGGAEQKVGGIMGIVRNKAIITNCSNEKEGKVEGHLTRNNFLFNAGGIVGRVERGHAIIRNCHNLGTIEGEYRMGGIVGHINSGGTIYVIDCHNEGPIQDILLYQNDNTASGGILGYGNNVHVYLINSYNRGEIHGHQAGGLIGTFASDATDSAYIVNSYNAGKVTSTTNYVGGIFGHLNSAATFKVLNVYNIGIVSGPSEEYAYGIGYINTTGNHTITNVYYNEKHIASNQSSYGWTQMTEANMKSPTFTTTLTDNSIKINVEEMKDRLIEVGLADSNYDLHVHKWVYDSNTGYPTIANEH